MIILYSGSFSPITYGHYLVITEIMTKYPNATMLIAPVNDHYRRELLPFKDRLEMIHLTIINLKKDHPSWEIYYSNFMETGDQPYNDAEWIEDVIKNFQTTDIYYLIGSDVTVNTWRQKDQDALKKIHLIVQPRANLISSQAMLNMYVKTGIITNLIKPVKIYFLKHFDRDYVKNKIELS